MKKVVTLMLLSLLTISVFGQTTFSKEYYLQKSKNQKKTGWILLGGGTLMAVIGAVSFNSNYNSSGDYGSTDAAGFLFLGGLAADLISIPFFISSSGNARKAATLAFKNQPIEKSLNHDLAANIHPTITLSIKINPR